MILNTEASIIYGTELELTQEEYNSILYNKDIVNQIQKNNMLIGLIGKPSIKQKAYYILGKELVNTESCTSFSLELENRFTAEEYRLYEDILQMLKQKNHQPHFCLASHVY